MLYLPYYFSVQDLRGRTLRTGTTVVTVTFKNIKTAKSTAKKYRCVVKAAIEPEKPVEPEVVKATKITEAKVTTAKTVSVTFDGAVDTSTATAIKLVRGTINAPVTVTYATDAKSATLTSETPLAAGTYTLTVGSFDPVSFNVTKQTATKLVINSTTVANTANAGVGFQVLDQYGDPMTNYTAKKLDVKAYNATKGHDVKANTEISKSYFELDCQTQDVSINNGASVINAIGDTVSVVAYLKDNASVSCTASLTITNIYMESLEFGEPELGSDKRVTVNKTYKLPYTAKTNEGNDSTFPKKSASGTNVISRSFGDYTFVSSNVSALDMGKVTVDKDGNLYFTAGSTAGTAVITAINNKTGSTVTTTIVVNEVATLSRVDVADASVAWNTASNTEVKAAVTAYDQFDEVIDAKNIKNLKFGSTVNGTTSMTGAFASVSRVPVDANIEVTKFSNDGKYLVYTVTNSNKNFAGQNVTFNFTSAKVGTSGYVTCKSTVEINDRTEPNALTIVAEPDATKEENGTVKVKFSVLDQYQNKVSLIASGTSMLKFTAPGVGNVAATTYTVEAEHTGSATGATASIPNASDDTVGQFEYQLENNISDLFKEGKITVKLMNGDDQVDAKSFDIKTIKKVDAYDVMTDKTSYTAGDTVTVTVDTYSFVGSKYNQYFNGSHNVEIQLKDDSGVVSTTRKTLDFKNGEATFTATAGTATSGTNKYYYVVTKIDDTAVTGSSAVNAKFTVSTNSANKIVVDKSSGLLRVVDSQGNGLETTAGTSYATVIVKDESLNQDITNSSTITSNGNEIKLNDKTAKVTYDADYKIQTIADKSYSVANGFVITVPGTSKNSNISLSITVNGYKWSDTVNANGSTTVTVQNAAAVEAVAVAKIDSYLAGVRSASAGAASTSSGAVNITLIDTNITNATGSIISWTTGAGVTVATNTAITGKSFAKNAINANAAKQPASNNGDVYTFTYRVELAANDANSNAVTRYALITVSYKFTSAGMTAEVTGARFE